MGISRISAWIIAYGEVETCANGPDANEKYQGIIAHSRNHPAHPYMPILSTPFTYANYDEAVAAMKEAVKEIRESVEQESRKSKEANNAQPE